VLEIIQENTIVDWSFPRYQPPTDFECERYMIDNRLGQFADLVPPSKKQADASESNVEGSSVADPVVSNSKDEEPSVVEEVVSTSIGEDTSPAEAEKKLEW
jgi:hypothetical protein